MASAREIQKILTFFQTSILETTSTLSSSSTSVVNDFISGLQHHALLSFSSSSSSSSYFSSSSSQEWLKTLHSTLRSSTDRLLGLRLLKETLRQCATDVFKANYVTWFRQLNSIAFVETSPTREERAAALQCLVDVIAFGAALPECARELTARDNVPQTVASLIALDADLTFDAGLACLIECARSFPGATGSVGKGKLEKKSLEILRDVRLADADAVLTSSAAKFFASLPKLGGAGVGGARYREAWESQFGLLIETLNWVVDELFEDVPQLNRRNAGINNNDDDAKKETRRLPLNPICAPNDPLRHFRLLARFRVLTQCLSATLSTDVGVSVGVPFTRVLSLSFRLCNVTPSSLTFKPTNESLALAAILPELYAEAVTVMRQALNVAGNRLFHHGIVINRLSMQMLNATSLKDNVEDLHDGRSFGVDRCFQKCRASIYDFLSAWWRVYPSVKTGTKGDSAAKWIDHILKDVRPPEVTKATLKPRGSSSADGSGGGKRDLFSSQKSSRQKKNAKGSLFESSSVTSDRKIDYLANASVCAAALKAAEAMILTQGRNLPPEVHKSLVEFCVPLCQSICLRQRTNLVAPIPYSSVESRLALFGLLKALILNPTTKWPPPLAAASALFRQGLNDNEEAVRHFCVEANVLVANLVHPRVYPVQMPIIVPKELEETVGRMIETTAVDTDASDGGVKMKRNSQFEDSLATTDHRVETVTGKKMIQVTDVVMETLDGETSTVGCGKPEMYVENASLDDEIETDRRDLVGSKNDDVDKYKHSEEEEVAIGDRREVAILSREDDDNSSTNLMDSTTNNLLDSEMTSSKSRKRSSTALDQSKSLELVVDAKRKVPSQQQQQQPDETENKKDNEEEEDPDLAAMLMDFNPDADPDPI